MSSSVKLIGADALVQGAELLGLPLTPAQIAQFDQFAQILYEWNSRINLTRIAREDFVALHVLDSLMVQRVCDLRRVRNLIDVGSGAGFPGIPIAIVLPELEVTLVDSTAKKVRFLEEVISLLGLQRTRAIHARAEALGREKEHRGAYHVVCARAVSRLSTLIPWLSPLMSEDGSIVCLKGREIADELQEAKVALSDRRLVVRSRCEEQIPTTSVARSVLSFTRELAVERSR